MTEELKKLRRLLDQADSVLIGAGAGLSTAAGLDYEGERFQKYFGDFAGKYGIRDMYTAGFYPYPTPEEKWAFWSRHIYHNRYTEEPCPVYGELLELIRDKDFFVLTTNVDHQFQRYGFPKDRLFYTQGDMGLWQCSKPCHQKTYDNREEVMEMIRRQRDMKIPSDLIPHCPVCGREMAMNLRIDDTFVEDDGWHKAAERYSRFLDEHAASRILVFELCVGFNSPGVIKYPFWQYTYRNPNARYAAINLGEAYCPPEIESRAVLINGDASDTIHDLLTCSDSSLPVSGKCE